MGLLGHFANLDIVTTLPKTALARQRRTSGVSSDRDVRRLAGAVARKYGRFAFPDEVVMAIDPKRGILRSKARKENSPLGKVLAGVYAIRVEAQLPGGWECPPYQLNLVVVCEPGVLPFGAADDPHNEPAGLREKLSGTRMAPTVSSTRIAELLAGDGSDAERYGLWAQLAESWARQCEEAAVSAGVRDVVASVTFDLVSVDEFPLSRVNNSEDLDLDYLSAPLPRTPKDP